MKRLFLILLLACSPAWATDYFACTCDTGSVTMGDGSTRSAHASCSAPGGDGSSAAAARATHTAAQVLAGSPGDRFLFCQGGKWNAFSMSVMAPLYSTYGSNPLTIGSYAPPSGATGQPILNLTTGAMFTIGNYSACNNPRGGLIFSDLHMHGASTNSAAPSGNFAVYGVGELRNIQFLRNTITGWRDGIQISAKSMYDDCEATTPGVYRQLQSNVSFQVLQGNTIEYNHSHGMLNAGSDSLIEGNTFTHNNMAGSAGVHAIYWAGASANYANERVTFRNNTFSYNSATMPYATDADTGSAGDGITCRVGNLTMRQLLGARIENNIVFNGAARDTCYGLNVNFGYAHAEINRDVRFSGNTVVNPGGCGICAQGAERSVITNNKIVMLVDSQTSVSGAISTLSSSGTEHQNSVDIRNNTLYLWGGLAINAQSLGTPTTQIVANNLIYFRGTGTRTAFQHDAKSTYSVFDGNLIYGATQFSSTYTTLGTENDDCPSGTASFDCNGVRADPQFTTTPSAGNGYDVSIASGSPATGGGSNTACARTTFEGKLRTGNCTIGAFQPGL